MPELSAANIQLKHVVEYSFESIAASLQLAVDRNDAETIRRIITLRAQLDVAIADAIDRIE